MELIMQNFNWPTFLLALGTFFLLQAILNLVIAKINLKRARQAVAKSDLKYQELKGKLSALQQEQDRLLGKKEKK